MLFHKFPKYLKVANLYCYRLILKYCCQFWKENLFFLAFLVVNLNHHVFVMCHFGLMNFHVLSVVGCLYPSSKANATSCLASLQTRPGLSAGISGTAYDNASVSSYVSSVPGDGPQSGNSRQKQRHPQAKTQQTAA